MILLGVPTNFVVGTDLAHMTGKSIVAARRHRTLGHIDLRLGAWMVGGTIVGVELGARIIESLEAAGTVDAVIKTTYVVILLIISAFTAWESLRALRMTRTEQMDVNLGNMMPGLFGGRSTRRRMSVPDALEHLEREAAQGLVDEQEITRDAIGRVESAGIIFLDEIDKIAGRHGGSGPDVSREGVQRDILPIVEGSVVNTRYGMVRTDHILFLAAGAFHMTKPADLIPELQGRFPIRVELDPLTREDLVRILKEPENSLVRQYTALLRTEGVEVEFTDDAVEAVAEYAALVNDRTENIGARRLHTVMEHVTEELSFTAPERSGEHVKIDAGYVRGALDDLSRIESDGRFVCPYERATVHGLVPLVQAFGTLVAGLVGGHRTWRPAAVVTVAAIGIVALAGVAS